MDGDPREGGEATNAPEAKVKRIAALSTHFVEVGHVLDDWRMVVPICLPKEGKTRSLPGTRPPSAAGPVAVMSAWWRAIQ